MSGTFSYTPDNVIEETIQHNTGIVTFENGIEQRRKIWSSPISAFKLTFVNRNQSEMENIRDFVLARYGAYDSFSWTNPVDSTAYTVRLADDRLQIRREAYEIYSIKLQFVEVK